MDNFLCCKTGHRFGLPMIDGEIRQRRNLIYSRITAALSASALSLSLLAARALAQTQNQDGANANTGADPIVGTQSYGDWDTDGTDGISKSEYRAGMGSRGAFNNWDNRNGPFRSRLQHPPGHQHPHRRRLKPKEVPVKPEPLFSFQTACSRAGSQECLRLLDDQSSFSCSAICR
ncbi:hypothetical protein ABID21_003915 [Pseudorhizobium tarimense]|uniref:EF-hand domain-containing protein n=1 Tax=Pseudorhizobium tarimense TaxID=1079109 RepID=A0ABV2HBD8_9HYPH|nr:hypothetical protein [Pseudorhizobium tarimense]